MLRASVRACLLSCQALVHAAHVPTAFHLQSKGASGYRGVTPTANGRYVARLALGGNKLLSCGGGESFADAEQAAHEHDRCARAVFGPNAFVNFPKNTQERIVQAARMQSSRFNGVSLDLQRQEWRVTCCVPPCSRKNIEGKFDSEIAAARAYDEHIRLDQ